MRAIGNWIDRFCRQHPRFGIPNLMNVIVLGTAIVYLLDLFNGFFASQVISFNAYLIFHGQIWRLVTFIFAPLTYSPVSFVLSLYFYWWIGSILEREWGTARFNFYYLLGVVLNIVFGLIAGSASIAYLNLSLFFAFAALYPDTWIRLFFFIPVKIKWVAWVDAAFFAGTVIINLVQRNLVGALLPLVAILNFLLFFWGDAMDTLAQRRRHFRHQHSAQTVNFKKATKSVYHEKGYIHKCAVCGKTDTDYPDMQFRYCSKCNGYYCYCEEHINNHVHIQ